MKKFLFILFGVFAFSGVFAAGENIPTSKSYVDAALATKQDKISASIIMPTGYTALEYIESTGTQWIDTGIAVNNNIGISIDFQYSNSSTTEQALFGHIDPNFGFWRITSFGYGYKGGTGATGSFIVEASELLQRHKLEFNFYNNHVIKLDNTTKQLPHSIFSSNRTLYLFAHNYNHNVYTPSKSRVFFINITDGTELVRNFIPARRDSDGKIGMYDTISGQFFTNSGTGEFIAGLVITPDTQVLTNTGTVGKIGAKGIYDANGEYAAQAQNLVDAATMNAGVQNAIDSEFQCIEWLDPSDHTSDCLLLQLGGITQVPAGYTQLEYIESTGRQWIDTEYILQSNSVIYEWKAKDKDESSSLTSLFGAEAAIHDVYSGVLYGTKTKRTAWVGNSREINIGYESDDDLFHTWKFTILDNNMFLQKDGIIGVSKSFNGILQNGLKLALFTNNIAGDYSSQASSVLLSYFKIYDNNSIARDMVPARRNSDGVLGMYDTVSNTFFTNAGTGEFIAGPVANLYLPTGE